MKNTRISLKDLKHIKPDNRYLFLIIFLIVLVLEGFVVKASVSMVIQLEKQTASVASAASGARVNFADYDFVVSHIDNGKNFKPTGGLINDPFNPRPAAPTATSSPGAG